MRKTARIRQGLKRVEGLPEGSQCGGTHFYFTPTVNKYWILLYAGLREDEDLEGTGPLDS